MKYGALDFLSDAPPPRVIGTEMEYDVQARNCDAGYIIDKGMGKMGFNTDTLMQGFLPNGGRLYRDVLLVEYATPECLTAEQLVLAEHAGRAIVQSVVHHSGVSHRGIYDRVASVKYRDSDEEDKTRGYHENYCIPNNPKVLDRIRQFLPTFLATRIIWSGSGYMSHDGFRLSQKAADMGQEMVFGNRNRTTKRLKPLILIADKKVDDYTGQEPELIRCEIRGMDSTHSWLARKLGFATTSLCLRLLEMPSCELTDTLPRLKRPIATMHDISKDPTLSVTYPVWKSDNLTAAEIQLKYAQAALRLRDIVKLPPEEYDAAEAWYELAKELVETDGNQVVRFKDRIDWVARAAALIRLVGPEIFSQLSQKAILLDLHWDRLDPHIVKEGGREIADLGRSAFAHAITPEDIEMARLLETRAPIDTAANLRSQLFALRGYKPKSMDWRSAKVERAGTIIKVLFEPYDTETPKLPRTSRAVPAQMATITTREFEEESEEEIADIVVKAS